MAVSNYSGYNPVTGTASWDGGGFSTAIGEYTISGPIATGTYNPDWNKTTTTDPGSTGPTGPTQAELDAANNKAAMDRQLQQQAYETEVRRRAAMDAVKAAFSQYGLESLYAKIEEYARADYSAESIAILLRQTPEYKARFPAMDALAKKGRAISEAAYIDYERTASSLEQRYGFPKGMIMGNVTQLISDEVSAAELNDRAILASASSLEAPEELKQTLKDYYGIDQGGLAAFYFDPQKALPLLEKQFATAAIGAEASKQGFGIDRELSAELQAMGVTQNEARDKMDDAARALAFTSGKGEVASTAEVVKGTFGNEQSAQKIERIADSRVGEFRGGGQFTGGQKGMSGIGGASQ